MRVLLALIIIPVIAYMGWCILNLLGIVGVVLGAVIYGLFSA